jgi:NH3-dependent NAD+ synthetase
MLPSKYTSDESLEDARECARLLGCRHDVVSIAPAVAAVGEMLPDMSGLAAENVQARLRMVALMALSNSDGQMLLTTGNKSEMSVGYATLYGDMAGGYSVLDRILEGLIDQEMSVVEVAKATGEDMALVADIESKVLKSEYKRRQAPPGVKIGNRNFGRDRRYPISNFFHTGPHAKIAQ